jgi:uncharacterized protein with HEPN domain
MTEKTQKYLSDVLLAIEAIEDFAKDIATYLEYQQDAKSKSAIERQLIIIGEALNQIRKEDEIQISNTDEIVGFRNRLVHAYDHIDSNIVWLILKRHLPSLKQEVTKHIESI